ncbi:condensation domain-containing protein [Cystobacter fuscus]
MESAVTTLELTESQQEFLVVAQMTADEDSMSGHQALALKLTGPLNPQALRTAVQSVIDRHEALRTTISAEGDRQIVHPLGEGGARVRRLLTRAGGRARAGSAPVAR